MHRLSFRKTFDNAPVSLRLMTDKEMEGLGLSQHPYGTVGIFTGITPVAIVAFSDLFDIKGFLFRNDKEDEECK